MYSIEIDLTEPQIENLVREYLIYTYECLRDYDDDDNAEETLKAYKQVIECECNKSEYLEFLKRIGEV